MSTRNKCCVIDVSLISGIMASLPEETGRECIESTRRLFLFIFEGTHGSCMVGE